MFKQVRKIWRYAGTAIGNKFEDIADPKVQLTQAIEEAHDQHRKLKAQAANVIANQKQTEIRLNRAISELDKATASARQAVLLADKAARDGDAAKVADYTRLAESLANRMIGLESEAESLKELHLQTTQASDQAKLAVEQNALMLQKKLTERQRLLSQLDQARMQEELNGAMAQLTESFGSDVPSLEQVRNKIEERYARALGQAAVTESSVEMQALELERVAMTAQASARLDQLRAQLGIEQPDQAALPAAKPKKARKKPASKKASDEND